MKSVDGVTQSSGCFVVVEVRADELVFTSTTTADLGAFGGVPFETCAPGEYCAVQTSGAARVLAGDSASFNRWVRTDDERCKAQGWSSSNTIAGRWLVSANNVHGYILLGVR